MWIEDNEESELHDVFGHLWGYSIFFLLLLFSPLAHSQSSSEKVASLIMLVSSFILVARKLQYTF